MSERVILLVEDEPDDEVLIVRALKKNDLVNTVIAARDGVEAIDYLFGTGTFAGRDVGRPPGLILLDLKLPKLHGIEVLRRLRADERTKRAPVVVLTLSEEQEDLFQSYDLGANSYIRKPLDADQFMEVMRQLASYWLVLNEPPPA